MVKYKKIFSIFYISFLLSSCALVKAVYLGPEDFSQKAAPQFAAESYNAENINGVFPDAVYIKTRTQTFNLYHYYIISDGRIWYKSIDDAKEPVSWTLFDETGVPHNSRKQGFTKTERITELSADADELVALSEEGNFYRYCFDKIIARKTGVWLDRQGWPDEEHLRLDRRTAANLSWALGKRNDHVLYYEDAFGNQHHNGTMEIATTYMLLEDGQEICYADTGLPTDFSRNYIGPERGAFKAVALSASASTMFVINTTGEMYTRLADFDTTGSDPMFFKYTYIPYQSDLEGADYFSNLTEWALPAEDWRPQPRIPLSGLAAITRHITILQNGQGNGARELRVAGLNAEGDTGYWTKAIFDDVWEFKTAPLYFETGAMLPQASHENTQGARGSSLDKYYSGSWWNEAEEENLWQYEIPNFNLLEGGCDLRIIGNGEICVLKLYPVELWTYLKRDYLPGRTGSPKLFMTTLVIPDDAFTGLSEEFAGALNEKFKDKNKVFFRYVIAASENYIFLWDTKEKGSVLFLTDGTISTKYPEFDRNLYVQRFEELRRYHSIEFIAGDDPASEELQQKIDLNSALRKELKHQIRLLKWSRLTSSEINFDFIPAFYTIRLSPLRYVDVPKLRTITSYGEQIVLINSAYNNTISNIRIKHIENIIADIEDRIRCYRKLKNS
ncbi:MAG: hypothetical protein LBF83_10395 [Spirochaetaceae bacterium]|nr:hypothetical protein [Spirochaetaceae bacterium]